MPRQFFSLCLLALFPILPLVAQAQLKDENLVHGLPTGYKVDHQARKGNMIMTEMVPQAESVKNWTEMLTSQIFLGLKTATPDSFRAVMQQTWKASCKDAEFASVANGQENGYPFAVWIQACPLNSSTGKPEHTFFKAIKGHDSFYVVQRAYKSSPTREQVTAAMEDFRAVTVCDSRLPDRPCMKVGSPAP